MSGNHRPLIILSVLLLAACLAAPALAQEPLPPRPGSTDLPPRPPSGDTSGRSSSKRDASSSAGGSYITLVVSSTNRSGLWAGVEWLDGASAWHRVEGWQDSLPDGGGV